MDSIASAVGVSTILCLMGGVFSIFLVIVVSLWKIFNKAGRTGLYAFIPLVSPFQWAKISGQGTIFAIIYALLVTFGTSQVTSEQTAQSSTTGLVGLIVFVLYVLVQLGLARRFRRGTAFAIGLILLPYVFYPILAFGNATYHHD
ncbi:MAG: hypothetical protein RLY87_2673 [Chloroflexota bacterium]|jgi:hypothetical protein